MRGIAVLFIALQKGQSNQRSHLPGYAAWELHPVMKLHNEALTVATMCVCNPDHSTPEAVIRVVLPV
jgi:hypothetical protein